MADVRGDGRQMGQLVRVPHEEHNADAGERGVVQRDAHEEKEEVAVVAPTDAVVEPGAVVVEALHTHMYSTCTGTIQTLSTCVLLVLTRAQLRTQCTAGDC